jgi:3-oxoacyl-[acyl-carrier-protein] synthase-1
MPARIDPLRISAWTIHSAAGDGRAQTLAALRAGRSGLRPNDFGERPIATWIGRVPNLESRPLPNSLSRWECRNNRLAWCSLVSDGFREAVTQAITIYGADRIAVIVGTSTSSIGASEEAYKRLDDQGQYPLDLRRPIIHTPHSLGDFVQHALGLKGICVTVATACSSSA